jgi:hypothetical protein
MSIPEKLGSLTGEWKGTNQLHTPWMPVPLHSSDSAMRVSEQIKGQFLSFEYTWAYEGKPEEGIIIVGWDAQKNVVNAIWTDSWHSAHVLMNSEGSIDGDGNLSMKGHYKVEGHPDWGWRTDIIPLGDMFKLVMYNVTPEGEESLAVETEYTRT